MLCKLHRKADGKFFVIYHAITPKIVCAGLADNMRGKEWNQEDLKMYGYIGGITDTHDLEKEKVSAIREHISEIRILLK